MSVKPMALTGEQCGGLCFDFVQERQHVNALRSPGSNHRFRDPRLQLSQLPLPFIAESQTGKWLSLIHKVQLMTANSSEFPEPEEITHDSTSRLFRPRPFSQLGPSRVVRGLLPAFR
jgi:hypothetical protein